jgi:uncharacterized protein YodC (DUF2158 family)
MGLKLYAGCVVSLKKDPNFKMKVEGFSNQGIVFCYYYHMGERLTERFKLTDLVVEEQEEFES